MSENLRKAIEINGRSINILSKDGQYWIAIKPICEALEINYNRQFKNIQNHKTLGALLANQPMVDAQNRLQEMGAGA